MTIRNFATTVLLAALVALCGCTPRSTTAEDAGTRVEPDLGTLTLWVAYDRGS